MLNKYLIAVLLFMLAGSAHGQEFCVRPIPGAEPISDTENKRASLNFGYPDVIAGYKGVVLNTHDYKKLFHFNGQELVEIKDDFPHTSFFAYTNIHTDLNGNSYGFGSKPKGIFYLPKGGAKWQVLDNPKEYKSVRFDQGSGAVYFSRNGSSWETVLNGQVVGSADMPDHESGFVSAIRTVPELSGVFALVRSKVAKQRYKLPNQSLWFKPEGRDWQKIDIPVLIDLNKSTFEVSGNLVRIFRGGRRAPLFLSKTSQGLKFQGVGPVGYWHPHTESKSRLAWIGKESQKLEKLKRVSMFSLKKRPNKLTPPKLFLLRNGATTAEEIEGVKPYSIRSKLNISYSGRHNNALGLHFIHAETGLVVFDGTNISEPESLRYANIGIFPSIKVIDGDVFIQSQKGVFRLSPELDVRRIESFPITEPWGFYVDINYFKQANRFLISDRRSDTFFTSSDMKVFTKLENEEKILSIRAVIQDPPTALVAAGERKVYRVTQDCFASE